MENKEKVSYEQLNDYCNQLMIQNRQLSQRLNQVMNVHNKLPFLFEVLKNSSYFSMDFINRCADEIEEIIYPKEEEEEEEEKSKEEE